MSLQHIYERASTWNALRYDRIYNHELTIALLNEEYSEYFEESIPVVKKLDALCDLTFVALGALWKLDIKETTIEEELSCANDILINHLGIGDILPLYYMAGILKQLEHETDYPIAQGLCAIIMSCISEMFALLRDKELIFEALNAVCDSNDTKTIHKTDSSVKANINKGEFFVAPEPRLRIVLEKADAIAKLS